MSLTLRSYQSQMLTDTRAAFARGVRRLLLVAPCGSGKTVVMAALAQSAAAKGRRVHLWAHRRELIDQAAETFIEAADIHTGIIAADYPQSPLAPVQVCSVQTLVKRADRVRAPDIVVVDEAHHQASATYATLAAAYPAAVFIGVTASPIRLDGRGLGAHFDEMILGPSTADLIRDGYLSPYKLFAASKTPSLKGVHTVAGDFNKHELAETMDASTVVGDAVSTYQQHCPTATALVFVWSIEASEKLAEQFRFFGIPAAHIDGETPKDARRRALEDFKAGRLKVICSVEIFGEGVNLPAVDAVFLLRPTQSLGLYIQQVGRGLRTAPGKSHVLVFDHVNNWQRHGLPDDPRVWSLTGRVVEPRETEYQGKRCAKCFGVSRVSAVVCQLCGAPFVREGREVQQVAGTLQAVDVDVLRQLGFAATAMKACQHCGAETLKRFCSSACFLAARRLWRGRTA